MALYALAQFASPFSLFGPGSATVFAKEKLAMKNGSANDDVDAPQPPQPPQTPMLEEYARAMSQHNLTASKLFGLTPERMLITAAAHEC